VAEGSIASFIMSLDESQVASRSGLPAHEIRMFRELGILKGDRDDPYSDRDVLRARLAAALRVSGITPEQLGEGIREGHVSLDFADWAVTDPISLLPASYAEVAEEAGMSDEFLEGLRSALGAWGASPSDQAREDDAELLRIASLAATMGFSEEIMLRALRVFNDNIRRVVDFELEVFRTEVEGPLLETGLPEQQMLDQMAVIRGQLEPVSARLLQLIHRRHEEHAFFSDVIDHVERALEKAGITPGRPASPPAIALLEVSGYTRMAEAGEERPVDYPVRLGDIAQMALAFGGKPVSILADVVMLHFPSPHQGLLCSLILVERIRESGLRTARVGMHAGPLVVRDGEYFGRTVNVARRIAEYARPGEVLVSAEVAAECAPGGAEFEEIGPVTLRGVVGTVSLLSARGPEGRSLQSRPLPAWPETR
jgi:adenylate cyclase